MTETGSLLCAECSDIVLRFMGKVFPQPNGCWEWLGYTHEGYGQMMVRGVVRGAHRVSWEIFNGPIPESLQLDHLCRNRSCVNPSHLEPVTAAENTRRRWPFTPKRTHCKHGHELAGENIYRDKHGHRVCRQCKRAGWRRYYAKRRVIDGRGVRPAERTHCVRGHEYTPENTYMQVKKATGRAFRVCRECQRIRGRAAYARKMAAAV